MTYKNLRTLPYILCIEIASTGNIRLLTDDETVPDEDLMVLWAELHEAFKKLFGGPGADKIFNVEREVEYLGGKYECIVNACEALEFARNEDLENRLREFRYKLTDAAFLDDIKRIRREATAIKIKISQLQATLPKKTEKQEKEEGFSEQAVFDQLASYSAILGIDFDYNTVSVLKVKSLDHQVRTKIKNIEKQNQPNKRK